MPTDDPELAAALGLGPTTSWRTARDLLLDAGWTLAGAGDWAWVLRSPSRRHAARISPFDPAARYTAALYAAAAGTGRVPSDARLVPLDGGASLLVMEHLEPVPAPVAADFHRRLDEGDPELVALAAHVRAVHARGAAEQPFWGPVDTNPGNVMRRADGTLVLTDPFYADGPALYGTAAEDPDRLVALVPAARRRHLTEIPLAVSGPWEPGAQERLRRALHDADQRARAGAAEASPGT
ncbi:hypothetical protein [Luteimicrobium sp. DT211]|uniref:hypothetical protein n=1 Tax=Luteimicrobium sp. DT211 TaxID=3393412 RepID=UPI003CE689E8